MLLQRAVVKVRKSERPEFAPAQPRGGKPGPAPEEGKEGGRKAEREGGSGDPNHPRKKPRRRHCTDKRLRNKMQSTSGGKSSLTKIYRKQKVRPDLPSKKQRVRQVELCQKRGCTPEKKPDKKRTAFPPTRGFKNAYKRCVPSFQSSSPTTPQTKPEKGRVRREEFCQKRGRSPEQTLSEKRTEFPPAGVIKRRKHHTQEHLSHDRPPLGKKTRPRETHPRET